MLRSVNCCLAVREAVHNGVKVGRQVNLGRAGVSHAAGGRCREHRRLLHGKVLLSIPMTALRKSVADLLPGTIQRQ
jgi:hypothetical protein